MQNRYLMTSQTTETLGQPAVELVDIWLAMAREEYLPGNMLKMARKLANSWKMNDATIRNRTCHNIINMAYSSYIDRVGKDLLNVS